MRLVPRIPRQELPDLTEIQGDVTKVKMYLKGIGVRDEEIHEYCDSSSKDLDEHL